MQHFGAYRKIMVSQGNVANRTTLRALQYLNDRFLWQTLQYLNDRFHVKRVKTSRMRGKGPGFRRRWKNV